MFTRNVKSILGELTASRTERKIFMVLDDHTLQYCWPVIRGFREVPEDHLYVFQPGESRKNLNNVAEIWERFGALGIDRRSLVINLGGGVVSDLGGFAASTLKRGIPFVHVPTTLLAMVDAAIGGKTGINFRGLKNEVGVIRLPERVVIDPVFLKTLPANELLSGYAEILKAALIANAGLWKRIAPNSLPAPEDPEWEPLIRESVRIKHLIVKTDPDETGLRKALNFGHTVGHALESELMKSGQPIPHGFAIAFGMVIEARLSVMTSGLPARQAEDIEMVVRRIFGPMPELFNHPERLIPWMRFDKKNQGDRIHFAFLPRIGAVEVHHSLKEAEILKGFQQKTS